MEKLKALTSDSGDSLVSSMDLVPVRSSFPAIWTVKRVCCCCCCISCLHFQYGFVKHCCLETTFEWHDVQCILDLLNK